MNTLQKLIEDLETEIRAKNLERESLGSPPMPFGEIKLIGQFGLLSHPESKESYTLAATKDIDAILERSSFLAMAFVKIVTRLGLEFDELSDEAWIPPEATYDKLHAGQYFEILVLKPEFILLSKAVKAPEKNGPLIVEALEKLGSEFESSLIKHGADLDYFRKIKLKRDERKRKD